MSNEIIDGDAELGEDGVLQGWCWNAREPTERPVVEILIDERIVSANVASRFREDLRTRRIGDGYYGFMTTLAKSLAEAGDQFVITARERSSGRCFWRHIRGEHAVLGHVFSDRVEALRQRLSEIAGSPSFRAKPSRAAGIAAELSVLGARLHDADLGTRNPWMRERQRILRRIAPMTIETLPDPRAAVIIVADSGSDDALSALAALAPAVRALNVSLVLIDQGASPEIALAPSLFVNLGYVFHPRRDLRSLLAGALKCSKADFYVFVRNPPAALGQELADILPQMLEGRPLHLKSSCAFDACRILGRSAPAFRECSIRTHIGLQFAGRRRVLERFIDLPVRKEAIASLGSADLAILALDLDTDLCMWDEPEKTQHPASPTKAGWATGNDAA